MGLDDIARSVGVVTDEQDTDDYDREADWEPETRDMEEYDGDW
jgi:hypothetical protein